MAAQICVHCDFPGDGNCSVCHGRGSIAGHQVPAASVALVESLSCPACGGNGHCQACAGLGEVEVGGEGD
jgi:DnaJ-class molecular chaperone